MQKEQDRILYSASDLYNFLDCEHLTWLDRQRERINKINVNSIGLLDTSTLGVVITKPDT